MGTVLAHSENRTRLFKSYGVLWDIHYSNRTGRDEIGQALCPNELCHCRLEVLNPSGNKLHCVNCNKDFDLPKDYEGTRGDVHRKYEGFKTLTWEVFSLDLPPSRITGESEDDHYWVKARISQKNGKKMAVIYFGEKTAEQTKEDYSQLFVDFDDELLRFDKGNKNPMKILGKLVAEFPDSVVTIEKKKNEK